MNSFRHFYWMRNLSSCVLSALACMSFADFATAQVQKPPRELFVPFSDLNVLLGNDVRRVFMTRSEFEQLQAKAKHEPNEKYPVNSAVLSATYDASLEPGRAILKGEILIEVLADGLHAIPLSISGVGIRAATLDDQPAAMAEGNGGGPILLVKGRGLHRLQLEAVLPVATAAAIQSLTWQMPIAPATKFHLSVPGNVELKSGAAVMNRRVDADANVTHFELLPDSSQINLVMSINNRRLRDETTLLARSVLIDEITQGYERLHATMSMNVLHGASDEFRFVVPEEFEITQVATPLLARWSVEKEESNPRVLIIKLREPATERVVINIRADRLSSQFENWQMPKLTALGVAGYAGVVGVLLEEQLASQTLNARGLIPVDNQVLVSALPSSLLTAEPGMPRVRPLVTYYAAQADFDLQSSFIKQPGELQVTTKLLLSLTERGLELDGGFALLTESEKLFSFEFTVPDRWTVDSVRTSAGSPLAFQRYETDNQASRIRVELPSGLSPQTALNVLFHATMVPKDWLSDWNEQTIELPVMALTKSPTVHESGAIAVRALDDLSVRAGTTTGLIVLSDKEKGQYGGGQVPISLAWRMTEEAWQGTLQVTRTIPRLTGRVLSFYQVSPDALTAHYELIYSVDAARTQRLVFSLPEGTPAEISVRGLDDTVVKEANSESVPSRRVWTIQLAERKIGRIRLAIDFVQPLAIADLRGLVLPEARLENVAYQSGLVAVEGHPEIDVALPQHPRSVDIGELIDADYQVGKRLLGAYSYVGTDGQVTIDAVRRSIHALPTTIVQRAELVSLIGNNGVSQTAARYSLRTKAQYLEIRLPDGAVLWSVMVDGQSAIPERQGDQVVVALPSTTAMQMRDLRVVYELPIDRLQLRGEVALLAPTLWQRAERDADSEVVPLADIHWEMILPSGYRLVRIDGSVTVINENQPYRYSWQKWLSWLVQAGGGRGRVSIPIVGGTYRSMDMDMDAEQSATNAPSPQIAQSGNARRALERTKDMAADQDPFGAPPTEMAAAQDPFGVPPATMSAPLVTELREQKGELFSEGLTPMEPAFSDLEMKSKSSFGIPNQMGWALAGLRSLAIDLTPARLGESVSFTSLGEEPELRATLLNTHRWHWLGLACGLLVFVIGLVFTPNRAKARLRYGLLVTFVALMLIPITGWSVELEPVTEAIIAGVLGLLAFTIIASLLMGLVRALSRRLVERHSSATTTTATGASLLLAFSLCTLGQAMMAESALAQTAVQGPAASQGPVTITNLSELATVVESLQGNPAVSIPADAIVVPYDPDSPISKGSGSLAGTEKLLVPYATYVELWNAAHPDKTLNPQPLVASFAWTGVEYQTALEGDTDLKIRGKMGIEVYSEEAIAVPLHIGGGVLESLQVDGLPARLQVVESVLSPPPLTNQVPAQIVKPQVAAGMPQLADTMLLLHLVGKGKKELTIELRMKIEKRGGWRVIEGRLPAASATKLTLRLPQPQTEVRLNGLSDRAIHDGEVADSKIETALAAGGRIALQWRAKIAEAAVDQGLSVDTRSVFDIQEDGLKLAWRGNFEFRRGRRESFSILVPSDYRVERVVGNNVRGWNARPLENQQQLTVDLLTTVAERESLIVFISRELPSATDSPQTIAVPVIRVPDAMLQQGQLAVRRSSMLELKTGQVSGLARVDTPDDSSWLTAHIEASPLPLKHYQAFQYAQVPFALELTAQSTKSKTTVTAQSILMLSQLQSTLESRLILNIQNRPVHHLRISVPANWKLEPPQLPVSYEWTTSSIVNEGNDAGQKIVDIYLASGLFGDTAVVLRGDLVQSLTPSVTDGNIPIVSLPKIDVKDADRQVGDIVVTSDPAFDVRTEQLQGFENALLGQADGWLAANQKRLARLLVHYLGSQATGQLRVSLRVPQVSGFSITNVKVTDRAIEETIFIELAIRSAGIRQIVLVVPASMNGSRLRGQHIRGQTWTPIGPEPAATVRLQVDLQEEIMGQYSLLLENDRLPGAGLQSVPIPTIETGKTDHRFITLENTSRDELIVSGLVSLEKLDRSQAQWRSLSGIVGGNATEAFVVRESAQAPSLSFATKDRAVVETVGARIGIAKTDMMVDNNGTYRAKQEYRVENRTEQFLEIELPSSAKLWTVTVADEPVKPMTSSATGTQRVRIPLVKTAAGDLDYPVAIKYGGQMPRPGNLSTTRFPLVKTINIKVELSQVRLRLPETQRWLNFGGTMGRVMSDEELTAGWLSFRTRQLNELTQLLSKTSANDFTWARATSNLKQLGKEVEEYQRLSRSSTGNAELQQQLSYNNTAWFDAQQQLQKPGSQEGQMPSVKSNRDLLNERFAVQDNGFSLNVANNSQSNFSDDGLAAMPNSPQAPSNDTRFDSSWLAGNALKNAPTAEDEKKKDSPNRISGGRSKARVNSDAFDKAPQEPNQQNFFEQGQNLPNQSKPMAPQIGLDVKSLNDSVQQQSQVPQVEDRAGQVYRYQQRLEANRGKGARDGESNARMRMGSAQQQGGQQGGAMADTMGMDGGMGGMGGGMGMPGTAVGGAMGPGGGGMGGAMPQQSANNIAFPQVGSQAPSAPVTPAVTSGAGAGYMASLDTELPMRGVEYLFSTPRGEIEITAQSFSEEFYERGAMLVRLALAAAFVWLLWRLLYRSWSQPIVRGSIAVVILLIGIVLGLSGITPLFALMAVLASASIAVNGNVT